MFKMFSYEEQGKTVSAQRKVYGFNERNQTQTVFQVIWNFALLFIFKLTLAICLWMGMSAIITPWCNSFLRRLEFLGEPCSCVIHKNSSFCFTNEAKKLANIHFFIVRYFLRKFSPQQKLAQVRKSLSVQLFLTLKTKTTKYVTNQQCNRYFDFT